MPSNNEVSLILRLRDEASAQWKKFSSELGVSVSKMEEQFRRFGGIVAAAFGIAGIHKFIEASDAQAVASAKLAQALKNQGVENSSVQAGMEAYAKSLQQTTAFSQAETMNIQSMLVAMTGLTGTAIEPLTKAVLDLSVGMGISVERAAKMISRTTEGGDSLKSLGIVIGQTSSESERLNIVVTQLNQRFGGLAEAASSGRGGIDQFKNTLNDVQQKFGDIIKSILSSVLPAVQTFLKAIESAPVPIQTMILAIGGLTAAMIVLGISFTPLTLGIGAVIAAGAGLTAFMGHARQSSEELKKSFASLKTEQDRLSSIEAVAKKYDLLKATVGQNKVKQDEIKAAIQALASFMPTATTAWDSNGKAIDINTEAIRKNITQAREALDAKQQELQSQDEQTKMLLTVWDNALKVGETVMRVVVGLVETLSAAVFDILSFMEKGIGAALQLIGMEGSKWVQNFAASLHTMVSDQVSAIISVWTAGAAGVVASAKKIGDGAPPEVAKAVTSLNSLRETAKNLNADLSKLVPGAEGWVAALRKWSTAQHEVETAESKMKLETQIMIAQADTSSEKFQRMGEVLIKLAEGFRVDESAIDAFAVGISKATPSLDAFMKAGGQAKPLQTVAVDVLPTINSLEALRLHARNVADALEKMGEADPKFQLLKDELNKAELALENFGKSGLDKFKDDIKEWAPLVSQALGEIGQIMSQSSSAEIANLESKSAAIQRDLEKRKTTELRNIDQTKTARLRSLDFQLKSEVLTTEQRKALELERFTVSNMFDDQRNAAEEKFAKEKAKREEEYNAKIKAAKIAEFEQHRSIAVIESIMNTAVAVTSALPNIFLAAVVGALGAIQTGIILSQQTPTFHTGTGDKTIGEVLGKGGSEEFPVIVKGDETIRTAQQEKALQEMLTLPSLAITPQGTLTQAPNIDELRKTILDVKDSVSILTSAVSDWKGGSQQVPQSANLVPQKIDDRVSDFSQVSNNSSTVVHNHYFNLNFEGAITTKEAFKNIVQDGMRELNLTSANDYFKNNRSTVKFS